MAAADKPLFIDQGATFHLGFNWHRAGAVVDGVTQPGPAYDLTGCTLRMQIRRAQGQPPLVTATSEDPYSAPGVLDPVKVAAGAGRIVLGLNRVAIDVPIPTLAPITTTDVGGTLADGTYYYRVTALNATGESLPSNEEFVTTTGGGASINTLSWEGDPTVTGFNIYRSTTPDSEVLLATVGAVSSYVDDGTDVPGIAVPPQEVDPKNGRIDITLTDEDTDLIDAKTAVYDLEIQWPLRTGDIRPRVDRLLQGQVTVSPNVTQIDGSSPTAGGVGDTGPDPVVT